MEDSMQKMKNEISGVKNEISGVKSKMTVKFSEIQKNIEEHLYPVGWVYIGRGGYDTRDDSIYKPNASFRECISMCEDKRNTDGRSWNGIDWYPEDGGCWCNKNDKGHDTSMSSMHFKA